MALTWTLEGKLRRSTEIETRRVLYDMNVAISTEEESSFILKVPTATVDMEVALPFQNAQMLAIFTDKDISIKMEAGGTAVKVGGCFIAMDSDIDELYISNSSGDFASVKIYVGGEPIVP